MFNLFGRNKTAKDFVAEAKETYEVPEQKPMWSCPPEPAPKEKGATVFYRFGVTDKNRVAFQMGYNEITMNRQGCQNLIDQLTFFMNQLEDDYVEEEGNSDDSSTPKN